MFMFIGMIIIMYSMNNHQKQFPFTNLGIKPFDGGIV